MPCRSCAPSRSLAVLRGIDPAGGSLERGTPPARGRPAAKPGTAVTAARGVTVPADFRTPQHLVFADRSQDNPLLVREPITRTTLGALRPLTHPRHLTPPARLWTAAEWELVRLGHRSASEHDRWNAYTEDGRLRFHRRGSGAGIYEVRFAPAHPPIDGWVITEVVMCADPEVHRIDTDELHALHVEALIDSLLLGLEHSPAIDALRAPEPGPAGGQTLPQGSPRPRPAG
jgi:hypothetical protein